VTRGREEGFALITTLLFVALLAFVAVIIEGWITTALSRAAGLKARVAAEQALIEATDRFIFMVLTSGFGAPGLVPAPAATAPNADRSRVALGSPAPKQPFIALDGRAYRMGDVVVRIQDEGGLYDLSNSSRASLAQLLHAFGVTARDSEAMAVELGQYQTEHPDVSTAPGRQVAYAAADLPPPRHSRLITPWEAYRILDWPHSAALWGTAGLPDVVTTGPVGGVGLNTAPAAVLMALTGIDEGEASRLIAVRQHEPITDLGSLLKAGTKIAASMEFPPSVLPSNILRLRLWIAGDPLAHVVSVRLTPGAPAPYRLDFSADRPPGDGDLQADSTIPTFPNLSIR
jgi:DNA uptake protein ComE-like DNA-binding protein